LQTADFNCVVACSLTKREEIYRVKLQLRVLTGLWVVCLCNLSAVLCALPAEGITPINNREYAPAVEQLMQQAHKSIYIMIYQARFYPEYPDTATNHFVTHLIAAEQRGVDVNLLVDTGDWDPSSKNEYNLDFVDRLTTSGVKVWEDSPQDVSHQKVICIDDDITVVSSTNWSYYSLAKNNEVAVIIYSPAVNQWFKRYFGERLRTGKPHANVSGTTQTIAAASTSAATGNGLEGKDLTQFRKVNVADVKPITNRLYYPAVHEALLNAKKSINVVQRSITLYAQKPGGGAVLPGEPASQTNVLVDDLVEAQRRGVHVRVVLDQTEQFDDPTNDQTAEYLISRGVPIFHEDLKQQTHAKMLTIDDDKTIVGSTNWTYPALEEGNEASVLITSPEVNKVYQQFVERLLQAGAPYEVQKRSIWDSSSTPETRQQEAD
jgi:cardiolipin synthase